jgi:hypothetical protein
LKWLKLFRLILLAVTKKCTLKKEMFIAESILLQ